MNELTQSRVASVLTIVSGAWLLLSPLFISVTGGALINLLIVGGVIALAGLVQLIWQNALPSWLNMLVAVWLVAAAFVFTVSTAMAWSEAVTGVVTFFLAGWDGLEIDQIHHARHLRI